MSAPAPDQTVGDLLRYWRKRRHKSQLDLSADADVSTRHVSFLETGRSQPSRAMLLRLGRILDIPKREQNALLQAAGFADAHRETPLDAPEMADAMHALHVLLKRAEPFPAACVDRRYDIRLVNNGWCALASALGGGGAPAYELLPRGLANALTGIFDPDALRPLVCDWPTTAAALLERVVRERTRDPALAQLVDTLLSFDGVRELLDLSDRSRPSPLVVPLTLRFGAESISFLSTITTLGTPQDLTLAELHIEALHPTLDHDEARFRALVSS